MAVTGIDKIVYGVEDIDACIRFFRDWGLHEKSAGPGGALFETADGSEVEVRAKDDAALPPAMEPGATVRRVIWGADSAAALGELRARWARLPGFAEEPEGPSVTDPNGLRLSLRLSRRRKVDAVGIAANTVDKPQTRSDLRGKVYERAEPVKIGHVVLFSPDVKAGVKFYEDNLGFVVSDYYPDAGYFLRLAPRAGHHCLFMLGTPDKKRGLNHVAFTVRDIHEVFGGGLHIARCGWKTQNGPGRHPISSAYFWYVHNPAGALAEYYADEDYCTEAWQPKSWVRTPENYAEWTVEGGLDGKTRRPARV